MMQVGKNPSETARRIVAVRLELRTMAFGERHNERKLRRHGVQPCSVNSSAAIRWRQAEKASQCAAQRQRLLMVAAAEPSADFE